jgi:acyl carrier protein
MTNEEKLFNFRAEILGFLQITHPTLREVTAATPLDFDSLCWTETAVVIEELFPLQVSVSDIRKFERYGELETDIIRRLMEQG